MADLSEQEAKNFKTQKRFGLQHLSLKSQSSEMQNDAATLDRYPFTNKAFTSTAVPQTPHRAAPNTSRKRLYSPVLFRDIASPSHSARMSSLFEDAASTLQYAMTPSRHALSNTRKSRIPSCQPRFTKFGHGHSDKSTPAPMLAPGCDSEVKFSPLKRPEPGCETLGRPPMDSQPTEPSKAHTTADGHSVCDSLIAVPQAPITTDPIEIAAAFQTNNDPFRNSHARRPIRYGFASPVHYSTPYTQKSAVILEPDVGLGGLPLLSLPANRSDSDDEEHSTHGVRLIMPYSHCEAEEAQQASIEAWLEQVLGATNESDHIAHEARHDKADTQDTTPPGQSISEGSSTDSDSEHARKDQSPHRRSSNKENVPPPLPPRVPPPPYSPSMSIPSQLQTNVCQYMARQQLDSLASKFTHPLTPSGFLSAPPKRKKLHILEKGSTQSELERINFKDFTIRDDEVAAALATLSPCVERHRKGHRPKRERCASYWDQDILEPDGAASPSRECSEPISGHGKLLLRGKRVLAEMPRCRIPTMEKLPVSEAAPLTYDYKA